ncbi:MAG: polysaccharide deacetylase family protein [Kofleriaceae bacterium]|nr:polysaccharide deacetylase family protein [Kofleriaceae bacterium]MBP6840893.1 polysaccharide deacetylase family protein [Kofleriaceae bacterium]MBP9207913.1 polysaccharide deacetylase family protein [Kofleriaceae bacterium]
MTRPAAARPRCAVSVDLDGLACYYRIHGLGPAPDELADAVLTRALPRFTELLARRGVAATFFVVGADVDTDAAPARAGSRAAVAAAHAAGHELGNHSYSHPYDLARLPASAVAAEIERCDDVLRGLTGAPIAGFRAPGYDVSPAMMAVLAARGYRYDSSVFPAPGYYAAKASVMAALAALGRPSGAVLTNPRALLAPPEPYWADHRAPWRRGQGPLVELPIAVTPWLRAPAIGTSLLLAPPWLRRRWIDAMAGRSFFNFELHGIDLADADADGIPGELVRRQPDLRRSVDHKLAALDDILDRITSRFELSTLGQAAAWAMREAA